MGQQQLLLIILGVIIVGVAIAVGISMFSSQSVQSSKDAILADINNIGAEAYQFKIRPTSMGGGNGVYTGYTLSTAFSSNPNATYAVTMPTTTTLQVVGTSKQDAANKVTVVFAVDGSGGTPAYTGAF